MGDNMPIIINGTQTGFRQSKHSSNFIFNSKTRFSTLIFVASIQHNQASVFFLSSNGKLASVQAQLYFTTVSEYHCANAQNKAAKPPSKPSRHPGACYRRKAWSGKHPFSVKS